MSLFDDSLKKLDKPAALMVVKEYWIINIPYYGEFVYYGTQLQAKEFYDQKCEWEHTKGTLIKADPENKSHRILVQKEIEAIWQDKQAGIKDLPLYPGKGWV